VYDTIDLLRRLQRDVKDLQKRSHELEQHRKAQKQSRELKELSLPKSINCTKGKMPRGMVISRVGTHMKPILVCTQPARLTSGKASPTALPSGTDIFRKTCAVDEKSVMVEFHMHLGDTANVGEEILKCRCRMDYLSMMISVVNEFHLELTDCNIVKLSDYFICIMRLKVKFHPFTNLSN
jgi:hypothetical protein